ncbi:UDP-glucose/GDP-mannose dehydrogenase family protein [Psychrobacter aestuarii]|uniref:UDP-glucose 6-dehydrogenase n=1 Tax=Psychrobacter aestuarii TaxID=556327 RepID=A0ABN0W2A8_9GAMM|nr:UDP-glucose/GDP-mannose dehydrogenase family protein [Psychrobacter aestuarii]
MTEEMVLPSAACVLIGHGIEAITSAVVLASLGHRVHLYADSKQLESQLQQYAFEHHLQALWQMYYGQALIVCKPLPVAPEQVLQAYEVTASNRSIPTMTVSLYWLFLDNIASVWSDAAWIAAFNRSNQAQCPVVLSGIQPIGSVARHADALQRAWVYYVPFVFLQDGEAFGSMLAPKLWLLGEKTADSRHHLTPLLPLMQHARACHTADIATIEFARSSIMTMLATRVSFMNEMSRLADGLGVDIDNVGRIMGLDTRVGSSYLQAGWGFGGHTLPTELRTMQQFATHHGIDTPLLCATDHINTDQKELIFRKFWQYFDGFIENKTVLIWGGSYKSGSGRTAGSAIHPLLHLLWSYNITTLVYADKARGALWQTYAHQPLLTLIDSPYDTLDVQAVFIVNALTEQVDIARLNHYAMPIFDAQNLFTPAQIAQLTGDYVGIGRRKDSTSH